MSTNRKITIFLASSEELINDRNSFHSLISTLDDIYEDRGIRIKLKRWEDFFAYCTGTRTQDEYNQVLSASDMCICLFHKRAGQYTVEEFHHAIAEYQRTGDHPKTYVYARALVEGEVEEEELKQFKEELFRQMGHYWCNYATEDSMKLHFIMQFERLINDSLGQREDTQNLSIEQGNVMLHGRKVADYNNIPFASNNTEVIALKEKIAFLDKSIAEIDQVIISLKQTIADFMDLIGDENHPKILARIEERNEKQIERNAKADERHQCQEQLEQLEKQLLDTALSISKMISSGHPISERKRAAIEMFEQGNNKGVLEMLNEEEIERDYQSAKRELQAGQALIEAGEKAKEAARDKIRSLVDEYLLKAKTWMSTYSEANCFDEACKCYEQAITLTRESLTEENLAERLFEYGYFLQENNQYHQIETYYQEALSIYERLATTCSEAYESDVASTLNNLANLYSDTQRFDQAEEYYLRALEIQERLAKAHPEAYEADVADTLHNLAALYDDTQRLIESEAYFLRALDIYERLATANPETYEADMAMTLNNLANLYSDTQRLNKAEEYYLRSLEIRKHLAIHNPKLYESHVADTLNCLAILYSDTQRFNEAENYYLGALEIYERLIVKNPEIYEFKFTDPLNNLANLYRATQRFSAAENYFLRVISIRERLATTYPEAYQSDLAISLSNLALLYTDTKCFAKSRDIHNRALEIQRGLVTIYPEVYGQDYAGCLHNASYFSLQVQNYAQAEEYSREALKWSDDINIYTNLAAAILLQGRFEEAKQIYMTYKDDLRDAFLNDFQTLKDNNAIPEHLIGNVEKIIELLNS